ncbi:hypothetical protein ILUMI_08029 [Ignelater luminosus]|uniref:Peptidase S1 domain-containing protein n=1 Tax=Ignelater luminosus TaxID=2038154 RepID=A0A8K0D583_IGNLU|nr:hypothetical protein ILUMI_08029 [Ignelater luminosus]
MFVLWHYFVFICLFHAIFFALSESNQGNERKRKKRREQEDDDNVFGSLMDKNPPDGKQASKGQFPFAISVQYWGFHYCSGALVSPKWVVSSGQCFNDERDTVTGFTLVAGMVDISDPNIQRRNLSKIIMHEKFYIDDERKLLANDIALLQPDFEFPLNSVIRPVKLPRPRQTFKGIGTLIGWTSHRPVVISLQYVDARLLTAKKCLQSRRNWPVDIGYAYHNKSMICAKPMYTIIPLCVGNTGSPLLHDNVLIGLSSTGANPCKANTQKVFIGYYTKISRHYSSGVNETITGSP